MKLKQVDIQGFKSFADKTNLKFPAGITAIVGPNGSGKSNIIEAIRWAMGEQSAKSLRGSKMNDIIFSGTSSRKSVNIAEVTLSFDNEDHFLPIEYNDVQVTRRLHRNGDSDYFINKQSCRLKDIVDLFTDSGFGKESFSIISQGQVEEIFNSKPEDRRAIFEEAAGVLKYKNKKDKAQLKLTRTKENLDRVQDIKVELERQLNPLQDQSEKARKYITLEKELYHLDLSVTVKEIILKKEEWEDKKVELDQLKQAQLKNENDSSILDMQLVKLKEDIKRIEENHQTTHDELLQLVKSEEKLNGEKQVLLERIKFSEGNDQRLHEEKNFLGKQKEDMQNEFDLNQDKLFYLNKEIKSQKKIITEIENNISFLKKKTKETIEELRDFYIEKMQEGTSLNNETRYFDKQLKQLDYQTTKTNQTIDQLHNEKKELKVKENELNEEAEQIKLEIDALLKEYKNIDENKQLESNRLSDRKFEFENLKNKIQSSLFKKNNLIEWQKNYSGFYSGVRAIMQQKELKGILGVVADVINVHPDSALAIETCIGSAGQFIIMENEQDAKRAIQFLKEKKAGRATFLPLTTIQTRRVSTTIISQLKEVEGFLGTADGLLSYEEKLHPAISNIFGRILVAKNFEIGSAIAKKVNYKYQVVTLDGNLFNAGGSLSGGSIKRNKNSSLISIKNDIYKLEKEIEMNQNKQKESFKWLNTKNKQIEKYDNNLEIIRSKGEELRIRLNKCQIESETNAKEIKRLIKEESIYQNEYSNLIKEKDTLVLQNETFKRKNEEVQQDLKRMKDELNTWTDDKEKNESKIVLLQNNLEKKRQETSIIREQRIRLQEQQESRKNQIDQLKNQVSVIESQLKTQNENSDEHLKTVEKNLALLQDKKEQQEKLYFALKQEKENNEIKVQKILNKRDEIQKKENAFQEKRSVLTVSQTKIGTKLDFSLEYLSDKYEMTFEAAKKEANPSQYLEEDAQKVKNLRKAIANLGAVNLESIEEYEEINERYEFLTDQQEDLLNAKEQLYKTMDEMDEKVKGLFSETFTNIQKSFSIIFPKMFGGGKAKISLSEPDNLLESGIEISAQPPGKRLQHLGLLSGGEKSLTAIALLFAIIQVRPVPFCILDEAEAALDEANIIRFGNFLRTFEDEPQFIVITHRKGTMEKADTLYGVTMQEKGVSKLVSVRLNEMEESISSS